MVVNVGDAGKPSTIAIATNYQDMLARTPGAGGSDGARRRSGFRR